ncbi:hypothetical protein [Borreliella garinii]|uniref:hypothetical protein n=1 Tax=Borreliella garinii TaxID=29519 RepID=UPI000417DDFD|nr:hypothetical protein [Borreliella garinii]
MKNKMLIFYVFVVLINSCKIHFGTIDKQTTSCKIHKKTKNELLMSCIHRYERQGLIIRNLEN